MIAAPLVGVVELRCCLQSVPRDARQNHDRKEAAGIDDGVGDGFVGRDDEVVDESDALIHVIVDGMAEDLPFSAPAQGDIAQFTVALPTKTKLVEFGRFAQRHAGKRGNAE